jgi:hypothetical protein
MNKEYFENEIKKHVQIKRHDVIETKKFIVNHCKNRYKTIELFKKYLKHNEISFNMEYSHIDDENMKIKILEYSKYFSFSLAYCEAINQLINNNIFLSTNIYAVADFPISKTITTHFSGYSSGCRFNEYHIIIPGEIMKPFSKMKNDSILFDCDLYINNLKVSNLNNEIMESLEYSINCFKQELYHPTIVMLGKALEGVWTELAISLYEHIKTNDTGQNYQTKIDRIKDGKPDFSKVLNDVYNYLRSNLDSHLNGIKFNMLYLKEAFIWSTEIRNARNAIHINVSSPVKDTYVTTAIHLIIAQRYIKFLYKLKKMLDK